ncbi:calcium-binding protein [Streptomyces tritici]|uniref:calcium-binding protein n=1 Tax=Streptomyces tritici TaxID=2054410 RepID=UPI003AEF7E5B
MARFHPRRGRAPGLVRRGAGGGHRAAAALATGGLALSLVLALPGTAAAAPGDLDPSFSGDGKVVTDVANQEYSQDVVIQPDGKIVTLGNGADFEGPHDFVLVRYNTDGSLDTTFGGGDGILFTDFGGHEEGRALTLASGGRIVAVGHSDSLETGARQLAVARYNADGSLDTTFSGDGMVLSTLGGTTPTSAGAVVMGTDDKIIVGGNQGGSGVVANFTAAGDLEAGWGLDSTGKTVFPGISSVNDLKIYGGETIVGAATGPTGFAAVRFYEPSGGPDGTFGNDGVVTTAFGTGAESVGLQGFDIVLAGSHGSGIGSQFALARYDGNGTLDPSFDGDGLVTTSFGGNGAAGRDLAVQEDGKLVVVGAANADFALARYEVNGALDTTFGGDGRVTTDFETFWDEGQAVALQADGKIVASGNGSDNHAVARYLVSGDPTPPPTVDLSVNKTGSTTVSLGDQAVYTITVTNTSTTTTATGVSVSDSITGGSGTMISATPSQGGACTLTATTATCPLGTIAPGASASFTLRVEPRATGTLWDGAAIGAVDQDDPNTANDSRVFATTVNNARGCTIVGTSSFETINGTAGNDVICALSGSDTVNAGGGSDTVYAGPGNDLVNGGSGNDRLIGQSGNDRLNGDAGNDTLDTRDGVASNDAAYGGFGFDTCTTDPGDIRNSCP